MVVKETHDGCFIFQSYAAINPERFWMAALQCATPITTSEGLKLWECPYYAEESCKSKTGENERPVPLYPQFEGDLMHKMGTGVQHPRMGPVTVKAPVLRLPPCNPSVEKWKM